MKILIYFLKLKKHLLVDQMENEYLHTVQQKEIILSPQPARVQEMLRQYTKIPQKQRELIRYHQN